MTAITFETPVTGLGEITAALVGRQNSGKTSLMMHLTGHVQKPVNFPGSSVERGESRVRVGEFVLRLVDLPGIASLSAVSPDEEIALDYLTATGEDRPQVICAVVDAAKLTVELTLVASLFKLGKPIVVALNKRDVAEAEGRPVDTEALADALGVPVVPTNAATGEGAEALRHALIRTAHIPRQNLVAFDPQVVAARVQHISPRSGGRTFTDRLDSVLLHRVWGLPILMLVMLGMFQALFSVATPFMDLIDGGQTALSDAVASAIEPGAVQSFLTDGLINGIGSILVFLPQIALLMLIVALLEGTGYMARAAFLLDRPLSRVGLSGRSFVPMVSSFACAVPGILASRIIENERDRIATIVVSPLMSCSARLPVYVLLIGAFFPAKAGGVVLLAMYLLGIVLAVIVAFILRRTVLRGPSSALMMELPVYQRPSSRVVWAQVQSGCRDFMVLAGTVIFAASVIIWVLSYYPRPQGLHDHFEATRSAAAESLSGAPLEHHLKSIDDAEKGAYLEQSFLADIGRFIHPVFEPAGWDWRTSVGVVAAFPARELIVPTLGILYGLGDVDPGDFAVDTLGEPAAEQAEGDVGLREALKTARRADGSLAFGPLQAVGLMVFFALCSQCAATLATIRRETRSWRWPVFTFVYMTVLAWIGAIVVNQVGTALGLG
ncbi:MAG: ferrous iron transport protein B [Deltaproteobacteria bacterium HGW-Deltaproteobacteria-14]|jgi:ferrous iron transport protein B|nr:MAG: ferrous iron transport protein B [Deltaproteobacteria bacterium HGW-Deltaproteobacteria-14]